jgi:hypothetical protein
VWRTRPNFLPFVDGSICPSVQTCLPLTYYTPLKPFVRSLWY